MDLVRAITLGVVEGLSEFLPISSTGHLVLVSRILDVSQTDFVKTFEIFIQLGAILAVPVLYWKKLVNNLHLWKLIVVGFLPAGVLGLLFFDYIKGVLIGNEWVTILALAGGGAFLVVFDKISNFHLRGGGTNNVERLAFKQALLIGFAQSVSMIPGVSRAAATIVGGLLVGMSKKAAVEFSFLLAMPTIAGATVLDIAKSDLSFSPQELTLLLVGFVGSFITAVLAIKFLVRYVQKHNFSAFGVYRIIVAVLYGLVFL